MRAKGDTHEVVWESRQPPGVEYSFLRQENAGWSLKGTVVRRFKKVNGCVNYEIEVDKRWRARRVHVIQVLGSNHKELEISVKDARWLVDGVERKDLAGSVDVDLECSPVTNTLPVRRTKLPAGKRVDIVVAWVRFPSLRVLQLEQSYERVSGNRWIYRSKNGFRAEIRFDDFGLVERYGDFWEAV